MLFNKSPEVRIIKKLDVSEYRFCNEAVLIELKNGMGKLCRADRECDDNKYYYDSQLLLNGKPLIRARYSICPTCSGLLAAGCGIENIDSPELREISDRINGEYTDIIHAAENIAPVLKLMRSGAYVIADIPHYPCDGDGNFFWHAPSALTENEAACEMYIPEGFFDTAGSYPAYLYPTQGADCFNEERAEHYISLFKQGIYPRALAYSDGLCVSFLLDGHHKAYAAAALGQQVNCTVIMPLSGIQSVNDEKKTVSRFGFGGIRVPAVGRISYDKARKYMLNISPDIRPCTEKFPSIRGDFPKLDISLKYPTIDELAVFDTVMEKGLTEENISGWLERLSEEDGYECREFMLRIICAMRQLCGSEPDSARNVAVRIVKGDYPYSLTRAAFAFLRNFRDSETEQIFVDYLVDHNADSDYWDIVNSYWDVF